MYPWGGFIVLLLEPQSQAKWWVDYKYEQGHNSLKISWWLVGASFHQAGREQTL